MLAQDEQEADVGDTLRVRLIRTDIELGCVDVARVSPTPVPWR
jgi:hypothetical protein